MIELYNWISGITEDGKLVGRVDPVEGKTTMICPGATGGKSWNQTAFSPRTGWIYSPAQEACNDLIARKDEPVEGRSFIGGNWISKMPPGKTSYGHIDAYDPVTGKKQWTYQYKYWLLASLLATAGDLVFTGDPEGDFFALDARSGQKLWGFPTGAGNRGSAVTYSVNGRQYIANPSGWGSLAGGMGGFYADGVRADGGVAMSGTGGFACLVLVLAPYGFAQTMQELIARGAELYAKTCATGYCHGVKGAAGGAPRLASRGFDETYILTTTRVGVTGTAMQAFGTTLPRRDLMAVVAYVATLNGIASPNLGRGMPVAEVPPRVLPADAKIGRELFFDSVRGFARCSTCHALDGLGIAVTTPIANIPANVAALRELVTPQVKTATSGGDSFPALVLTQGVRETKVYDLTLPPPVLRVFPAGTVKVADGSAWKHSSVLGAYQDAELASILSFLRAVVTPAP